MAMKATSVRTKTFSDTTAAGLDAAIATFVAGLGEGVFLGVEFAVALAAVIDSGDASTTFPLFAATVIYTT